MKQYEGQKHGTDSFPVGIYNTVFNDGFSLYPHIHREFEFLVMNEGRGILYIEEEKFEIKKGEGVFINSEELHIGVKTDSEKAEFYAVVFAPEIFGSAFGDKVFDKFVEPVLSGKIQFNKKIDKDSVSLVEKIFKNRDNELCVKACLFEIWNNLFKYAKETPQAAGNKNIEDIKKVMEYMTNHCSEQLSLEDIASFANMSKGYLCRQFTSFVHRTPFEYLIDVRIDKSCEYLKNTNLSIGEIATRCGFNSFSYFSKVFREKMGCSPKDYRK